MRASLAALVSIFASSLCCLPLGTLLLAAGSGGAAFLVPPSVQPLLLALSIVLLGFGAWRTFVRPSCTADRRWYHRAALVIAALAVAAMWLAPQQVASLLAGSGGRMPAAEASAEAAAVTSLDVVRERFNEASGDMRLLVLLSPT